jgi:hypothetical protein
MNSKGKMGKGRTGQSMLLTVEHFKMGRHVMAVLSRAFRKQDPTYVHKEAPKKRTKFFFITRAALAEKVMLNSQRHDDESQGYET